MLLFGYFVSVLLLMASASFAVYGVFHLDLFFVVYGLVSAGVFYLLGSWFLRKEQLENPSQETPN